MMRAVGDGRGSGRSNRERRPAPSRRVAEVMAGPTPALLPGVRCLTARSEVVSPAALVRRFPLVSYFVLAYAVSAVALAVLGPPSLAPGGRRNLASLVMFPVMVVAVGLIGVALTGVVEGRRGLRELGSRWR